MSTSTGTLDSSIAYFPFGSTRTGSVNTTKKFTGQRLDGTGLYYYGARYYDATIGRFISPDSVGQKLTDPQSLNRYTYCTNNPLRYTDPTGHDQIITTGGVDDNGETWYTICDGQGNLLAIATGIDDLAQKMNDCDAVSRNVDLPLGKAAADFINSPKPAPPCGPVPDPTPVKLMPIPPAKQDSMAPYSDFNCSIGIGWGITFGLMTNTDGGYSYIGLGFMSTPGIAITGSGDGITTGLNFAFQIGAIYGEQHGISDKMGGGTYTERGIVTPGWSITGFWVWKLINPTRK